MWVWVRVEDVGEGYGGEGVGGRQVPGLRLELPTACPICLAVASEMWMVPREPVASMCAAPRTAGPHMS